MANSTGSTEFHNGICQLLYRVGRSFINHPAGACIGKDLSIRLLVSISGTA